MFEWVFDLPIAVAGPGIVAALVLYSVIGLRLTRRYVLSRMRINPEDGDFASGMLQAVMTVYGLALALIAVSVWQTYNNISSTLSQEAAALAELYRDVSGYPEPARTELQEQLRDYVNYLINDIWPLQRRGQFPTGGIQRMNEFQKRLFAFEPVTEGQKILHTETLHAYNEMMQFRRQRLDAVLTTLPSVLWLVVILGALLGVTSSFFFKIADERYHLAQVVLLAALVGMVIFIIVELDRPFRGDLGLGPNSYQLIYDQLMKEPPGKQGTKF
jgi:hypothetical protein